MDEAARAAAVEAIRRLKAKYWRGVDTSDGDLVRSVLAEDCVLDYRGCCTDPASGVDFMPTMNVTLNGRASWISNAFKDAGIVTVHQGHHHEITVESDQVAQGTWAFTDRFFLPPGGAYTRLTGYGYYHETYSQRGGEWLLQTTRITRLRVEVE